MKKGNKEIQKEKGKKIKEIKKKKKSTNKKKKIKFKNTKLGKILKKIGLIFSNEKNNYSFSEVFIITLVSLVIGFFACSSIFIVLTGGKNYFKMAKELSKFYEVYDTLVDNYYGDVSKDELIDKAISGMVTSVGDVYTSYVNTDSASQFDEMVNGVYEGIGCTIQQIGEVISVISLYEDGPADKAGIKVNDIIKTVDSMDVSEMGATRLSEYIKNEASSKVSLVIIRDDEELTITVKRDKVEIPVVEGKIIEVNDKKIGYLDISIFSSVAANQFEKKLKNLEKQGIEGLVIDVRDNNGGYLTTVSEIASYLLPKGSKIYQIQKDDEKIITKDKTSEKREYPIAILVNGNSASASEILAGAIKESYGGYVVGTTTFGKGTVQQVKKLSDGSMIKYTVENWLTPNGNWIDNYGIEPTNYIELSEEYNTNPTEENDNQLKEALNLVS